MRKTERIKEGRWSHDIPEVVLVIGVDFIITLCLNWSFLIVISTSDQRLLTGN